MGNVLFIDTSSNNKKIIVGLRLEHKKTFSVENDATILKSQILLILIDRLLSEHNLGINDINEVKVNLGPGSFTGLRVGIAVANTLGFALKIPINGKKLGELMEPLYNN
ncbi:MAG: tRNA (adenosine(37)-N6)-threonylcarbamoyltransferase complex dimerization subunit type 1 TsaB [Patescibacteria group bacterium]|nr:tRNA (adenosine(37)-N6)-threonylcarbamoyltransferase complex dimerization subunit type 1 TsaB [Patescibacteria group bacterium]